MNQQHALLYTVVAIPHSAPTLHKSSVTCSCHCKGAKLIPERGGFPVEKKSLDGLGSRHSTGGKHCTFPAFSYEVSITPEVTDILNPRLYMRKLKFTDFFMPTKPL